MRLLAMIVLESCLLVVGIAPAFAAPDWKAAEHLVRERLAAAKVDVVEITAKRDTTLGTAFWVRRKASDGKLSGQLVVVRGTTVFDTPGDATISAILKTDAMLVKRTISARDLLYLLQQLGTLPPGLGNVLTEYRDKSLLPKLSYAKDHATLVLHSFRRTSTGSPNVPKQPLVRATLTIASDYTLTWKVEQLDRPR
jgi:hypothetical protein